MEQIRAFIFTFISIFVFSSAQSQSELTTRIHLVGGSATIAPGFQKGNSDINQYIHGFAYFYPEPKVSINGELYWYLGAQQQQTLMAENSTLLFGSNFHFVKDGKFDPFVGIMPAVSMVSANDYSSGRPIASAMSFTPLFTMNAGLRFHFVRWFNGFLNFRYLKGNLVENHTSALSLDEFRISFGLGFNFYSTVKRKKTIPNWSLE